MIRLIYNKIKGRLKKYYISLMNETDYANYLRKQGVIIGNNCSISKTANFGSEPYLIKIGNNVRITQGVQFITHDGGIWTLRYMGLIPKEAVKYGNITIGDNCNISWNAIVMPNVHIGKNCVIAAGAVVTHNIPDGEVWGGVPARKIETIADYFNKIKNNTLNTFSINPKQKEQYLRANMPQLFE